jgi:PAS domain S-box-containing protein
MPDKAKQLIMDWVRQGAFDAFEDAISIQDTDFKVLYQNDRHKNMIGEYLGEYCYKAYQRKDNVCDNCHLAMSFKDGKVHKIEQVRTTVEGRFYYEISSAPLRNIEGRIIAGMEVVKDISKRRRAEEALTASEERYRWLVSSLQEGIWALDKEENTSFVNNRMAEMLGYTVEEMLGKKVFDFMDERGVELCKKKIEERKAGVKEEHDFELIKKDGSTIYVTMEASPIQDDNGNYVGGVAGVIDISERVKAEEELKKYREYLEQLVKERTGELEKQKSALEDKNIALREVIGQIELEKNKIRENIISNIEELVIPILKKTRAKGIGEKQIDLIEQNLKKVTSSFGVTLSSKKLRLTPREIDVCNLVEKGLSNKEMANFLNISTQSIEGYRKNIRKKLGLASKKINLSTYLRNVH